jgi:regulator of Ty1 transposition protein 103
VAFSPVIAEATAAAYKGATSDVQNKLRRVVEVWRQRNLFEPPIQTAIEARLEGKKRPCSPCHFTTLADTSI